MVKCVLVHGWMLRINIWVLINLLSTQMVPYGDYRRQLARKFIPYEDVVCLLFFLNYFLVSDKKKKKKRKVRLLQCIF